MRLQLIFVRLDPLGRSLGRCGTTLVGAVGSMHF